MVPTPDTAVCGSTSNSTIPSGSFVPTRGTSWTKSPSAHTEALMQHFQAAGFSEEVSRLAKVPRRASINRMYEDRWLQWASEQGFDPLGPTAAQIASFYSLFDSHGLSSQMIKGYRSCLASILGHTGRAALVQVRHDQI